ncbi:hypothetical protein C8N35_101616 [Breoghania corrubedonensis]|uniref:Uncharacterized protein n=1 Tax=Breoghania corrubedonensis TaxID=665038 RepID=A0A2T5VFP0_9HYPH|nr:hypothetical protein C8N35_101616 [Breoghania corrubedonensis]
MTRRRYALTDHEWSIRGKAAKPGGGAVRR